MSPHLRNHALLAAAVAVSSTTLVLLASHDPEAWPLLVGACLFMGLVIVAVAWWTAPPTRTAEDLGLQLAGLQAEVQLRLEGYETDSSSFPPLNEATLRGLYALETLLEDAIGHVHGIPLSRAAAREQLFACQALLDHPHWTLRLLQAAHLLGKVYGDPGDFQTALLLWQAAEVHDDLSTSGHTQYLAMRADLRDLVDREILSLLAAERSQAHEAREREHYFRVRAFEAYLRERLGGPPIIPIVTQGEGWEMQVVHNDESPVLDDESPA